MGLNEWLTVAAVIIGPIVAVAISLWIEHRRRERDGRMMVLRQLLITRHLPADPGYSAAVNLVAVEYNGDAAVMTAYKEYQRAINVVHSSDAKAVSLAAKTAGVAQTKMLFAIMRSLGLNASEADLPAEAYAAQGMIDRDDLYLRSLFAQVRTADALEALRSDPPVQG